ncbi:hypothetical protein M6B38_385905 [Iris pallida]|uniref:Uncharacterized protein n=1 Tax=Iris pallida TaxID=29817 RepID=A0AAX6G2L4_IRIPA|nr:hypothetical protein M6B38_385905 [Iris pallida]
MVFLKSRPPDLDRTTASSRDVAAVRYFSKFERPSSSPPCLDPSPTLWIDILDRPVSISPRSPRSPAVFLLLLVFLHLGF